jgi:hypothetical protein
MVELLLGPSLHTGGPCLFLKKRVSVSLIFLVITIQVTKDTFERKRIYNFYIAAPH